MSLETTGISSNDTMRSSILEAARELFAKFGYKKTTMEDIAHALRKGKSSLYYYFKNKEEIFQAVIKMEEDILFSRLHEVLKSDISPQEKLMNYVIVRMETIRKLDNYYKALRDDMFGDYDLMVDIKGKGEKEEAEMLKSILEEGVRDNSFTVKDTQLASVAIAISLKGLEVPLFKSLDKFEDFKIQIENVLNILFYGLIKR
ncbi:TetR/AcrR family transcriptional regulator [Marinilabiliaceae bacterium JC017]|nr:TetR/AcrR family transcriptional regulator [Marinilabiliaceae bacterium JC017]